MLPVSSDYLGASTEVRSLANNAVLATGKIIKIDHDAIEIAAERGNFMQLLQYKMTVKLYVRGKTDAQQMVVLAGVVYLSTGNFLRIEEVKTIDEFERRGAFRVNSIGEGKLYPLLNEQQRAQYEARLQSMYPTDAKQLLSREYVDVRVMDISLTGVRIASRVPLSALERYRLDYAPLKAVMNFSLRLQRLIHMPGGTEHYGCSFYDMSNFEKDLLVRDLFQMQRMEKNRMNSKLTI